jgi:hypothetical protein
MHAIIFFIDDDMQPVRYSLACTDREQAQLQDKAEQVERALTTPAHVCQCEGKCQHRAA